jgi:hypothetical protein
MAPGWLQISNAQDARPPRTAAEDIQPVYKSPRPGIREISMPIAGLAGYFSAKNHVLTGQAGTRSDITDRQIGSASQKKNNNHRASGAASAANGPE